MSIVDGFQQRLIPQTGIDSGLPISQNNTTGQVKTGGKVSGSMLTGQQLLDKSMDLQEAHQSPQTAQSKGTNLVEVLSYGGGPVGPTMTQKQIESVGSLNIGSIESQPDFTKVKSDFLESVLLLVDRFGEYNDSCSQLGTILTSLDNIFADISDHYSDDILNDESSAIALLKEDFTAIVDTMSPNEKALIYHTLLKNGKFDGENDGILKKLNDSVDLKVKGLKDEQDAINQKIDQLDTKDLPDDKQEENKLEAEFKVLEYKISEQNAVKDSLLKCKYLFEVLREKIADGGDVQPADSWDVQIDYKPDAVIDFISQHKDGRSGVMYNFILDFNNCRPEKREAMVQFYSAQFGFDDCKTVNDLAGKILKDRNLLSILNGELKFMGKDGRRMLLEHFSISLVGSDVNYQDQLSKHIESMNMALNLIEDEDQTNLVNKLITGKDEKNEDVSPADIIYEVLEQKITAHTDEAGMIFDNSAIRNQKIKNFFRSIANFFASIFKGSVEVKSLQEEYLDKKVEDFVNDQNNIALFKNLKQYGLYSKEELTLLLDKIMESIDSTRGVSIQEKDKFVTKFSDSLNAKITAEQT